MKFRLLLLFSLFGTLYTDYANACNNRVFAVKQNLVFSSSQYHNNVVASAPVYSVAANHVYAQPVATPVYAYPVVVPVNYSPPQPVATPTLADQVPYVPPVCVSNFQYAAPVVAAPVYAAPVVATPVYSAPVFYNNNYDFVVSRFNLVAVNNHSNFANRVVVKSAPVANRVVVKSAPVVNRVVVVQQRRGLLANLFSRLRNR